MDSTSPGRSPFADLIGTVAQAHWERAAVDGRAARASGNHLTSQNDEPEPGDLTEEELDAEVRRLNAEKDRSYHGGRESRAIEADFDSNARRDREIFPGLR